MGIFGSDNTITIRTPQAAEYGRNPNGATAARDEWLNHATEDNVNQGAISTGMSWANQEAQNAQNRPGAVEDVGLANNAASGAGGNQAGAVTLAKRLATGSQPSAAAYQLQAGLNNATAQQTALGRSARGAGAIATAGANAQGNTAALQQNAYLQGGLLRSRDMAQGRNMYGGLLGQQREQDTVRIGQANEMSQFNASNNDRYGLQMGQAAVGFGDVANQQSGMDLNYYQRGMNPVNAQSEADQARRHWLAQSQKTAVANNSQEK